MTDEHPAPTAEADADRIRRLEELVETLRRGQPTEDQLADRVVSRIAERVAQQRAGQPGGYALEPADPVSLFGGPPEPPGVAPLVPILPTRAAADGHSADRPGRSFLAETWRELRLMVRMYFDPRYRLSRIAQLGVPAVLAAFVANYLLFTYSCLVPFAGPVLERLIGVLLAVGLYKILAREVGRYQSVLDYLARFGYR